MNITTSSLVSFEKFFEKRGKASLTKDSSSGLHVKAVMQTSSKTAKALRAVFRVFDQCGHAILGKGSKNLLKQTKLIKPVRAFFRVQKFCQHVNRFRTVDSGSRKVKSAASLARDTKSLAVSTAIVCEFAAQSGLLSGRWVGWIPYLDAICPFVKVGTLGISINKLVKARNFSAEIAALSQEMEEERRLEEVVKGLSRLTIQKKVCFSKKVRIGKKGEKLQTALNTPKGAAAIKPSIELIQRFESRARMQFYLQALTSTTKVIKIAGAVMVLTGVVPVLGKRLVHGAVIVNFLNWSGQKIFWSNAL
jgi:hypothetical protein